MNSLKSLAAFKEKVELCEYPNISHDINPVDPVLQVL